MKALLACVAMGAAITVSGCESLLTGGPLVREGEPTGTILVTNDSRYTIDAVLISDCGASTYGLNRMGKDEKIPPGGRMPFTVSAGCWDVDAGSFSAGEFRKRLTVEAGGTTAYSYQND
jgi:hypothetical protein